MKKKLYDYTQWKSTKGTNLVAKPQNGSIGVSPVPFLLIFCTVWLNGEILDWNIVSFKTGLESNMTTIFDHLAQIIVLWSWKNFKMTVVKWSNNHDDDHCPGRKYKFPTVKVKYFDHRPRQKIKTPMDMFKLFFLWPWGTFMGAIVMTSALVN